MSIWEDEWIGAIGYLKGSTVFSSFIECKGLDLSRCEEKIFGNTTLYNLYQDGLSFAFVNDKLDSIDFFQVDKKFKPVKKELLPLGIKKETKGKDLVEIFGEPLEKGGGMSSKMDIWLRWENLQVEIDEISWDSAKDVTWKSITIFSN